MGRDGCVDLVAGGWKFDGVAGHGDACVSTLPGVRAVAQFADGKEEVQYYPQIRYQYSNDQQTNAQSQRAGCLVTQYFKAEDFLTHVLAPALHPGVKFEVHPMPEDPQLKQQKAHVLQMDRDAAQHGMTMHTEVGRYLLGFDLPEGHAEAFIAVIQCQRTRYAQTIWKVRSVS